MTAADDRRAIATIEAVYEAFNRRDIDAVIALLHPDIVLHPLRLSPPGPWHGHDGIRRLADEMREAGLEHRLEISEARLLPDGRVAALGDAVVPGARTAFVGVHRLVDGLIAETYHYFSDEPAVAGLGRLDG